MPKAHLSADLQGLAKALKVTSGPIVDTSKWAGTVKGAGSTRPHLAALHSGRSDRVQRISLNCAPIGQVQLIGSTLQWVQLRASGKVTSIRPRVTVINNWTKIRVTRGLIDPSSEAR